MVFLGDPSLGQGGPLVDPIFISVLGITERDIPKDKIALIKIKGLSVVGGWGGGEFWGTKLRQNNSQ